MATKKAARKKAAKKSPKKKAAKKAAKKSPKKKAAKKAAKKSPKKKARRAKKATAAPAVKPATSRPAGL